jgi:hypothetical protein
MSWNIANALLILGSLYFYFVYHMDSLITLFFVLWALAFWSYHAYHNEKKKLLLAQIRLLEAKSTYFERKSEHA